MGHNKSRSISVVLFIKRRGVFVMAQLIAMHTMRQIVRNENESSPARGAQGLLHVFVADACIGFSRVWSPHPPFY